MQYTKGKNMRPPSVGEVVAWVRNSWKYFPDDVVGNSITAFGISEIAVDYRIWHINKHDVYGGLFKSKWMIADEDSSDDEDGANIVMRVTV